MAEYKEIKGYTIKVTDTDPIVYAGAWATGNNMNTARQYTGSFGSQTAGLVAGGETSTAVNSVEQYDGISWTDIAEINTTRYGLEGFGNTSTSGFVVGGAPNKAETESWNGSAWTEVADLPAGTERGGCAGTSTSAFYVGGYSYGVSPNAAVNTGYDWNGSSWGTGNNINTTRDRMGAAGVVTSGIVFGGTSPGGQHAQAELYDGSAWTQTGTLNTARRELGASSFDRTNSQALGFGGEPPAVAHTESFDGSVWTEVANLSTARAAGGGLGTSTLAAFAGGSGLSAATEEWSFPSTPAVQEGQVWIKTAANTDTVMKGYQAKGTGAWSTGGSLNTARGFNTGAGTQTAALSIAGYDPGGTKNEVESYDGTSWTEIAEVNDSRSEGGGFGSQTAANFVGGNSPTAPGRVASNESWNGSSWTEVTNMPATTDNLMQGAGTATAGMVVGGQISPGAGGKTTNNVFYDGTNWTAQATLNAPRSLAAVSGNQTSALIASGLTGSPTTSTVNVEEWNGSAWTEVANVNSARYRVVGSGDGNSSIAFAGTDYPSTTQYAITESWNGSSWTEIADLSTGREGGSSTANTGSTSSLMAGGSQGSTMVNSTEEWTVPFATKTFGTD